MNKLERDVERVIDDIGSIAREELIKELQVKNSHKCGVWNEICRLLDDLKEKMICCSPEPNEEKKDDQT